MLQAIAAGARGVLLTVLLLACAGAFAQTDRQRAPGFAQRAADSRLVIVPADMELFSISKAEAVVRSARIRS